MNYVCGISEFDILTFINNIIISLNAGLINSTRNTIYLIKIPNYTINPFPIHHIIKFIEKLKKFFILLSIYIFFLLIFFF